MGRGIDVGAFLSRALAKGGRGLAGIESLFSQLGSILSFLLSSFLLLLVPQSNLLGSRACAHVEPSLLWLPEGQ